MRILSFWKIEGNRVSNVLLIIVNGLFTLGSLGCRSGRARHCGANNAAVVGPTAGAIRPVACGESTAAKIAGAARWRARRTVAVILRNSLLTKGVEESGQFSCLIRHLC